MKNLNSKSPTIVKIRKSFNKKKEEKLVPEKSIDHDNVEVVDNDRPIDDEIDSQAHSQQQRNEVIADENQNIEASLNDS